MTTTKIEFSQEEDDDELEDGIDLIREQAIIQYEANPELFDVMWKKASIRFNKKGCKAIAIFAAKNPETNTIDFRPKALADFLSSGSLNNDTSLNDLLDKYVRCILYGFIPLICLGQVEIEGDHKTSIFQLYPLGIDSACQCEDN